MYNLYHLNQPDDQDVIGPIQDDEALLLYALIRCTRLKTVLEIGSLAGYSARNFLEALPRDGKLYTIDINPVETIAPNHIHLTKNCNDIKSEDFQDVIDVVFFDCHMYDEQLNAYSILLNLGIITDQTVLILHDTNLHPGKFVDWAYPIEDGYCHQPVERRLVNEFKRRGYSAFSFHTKMSVHNKKLPFRHGITIMQKHKDLAV